MEYKDIINKNILITRFSLIYIVVISLVLIPINYGFITYNVMAEPYDGLYYYVNNNTGSDSNNGSFNYPFKTIQKACNVATNGDTVYIMAGVYTPSTGQIQIRNKNTANEWLTIRNYNNDYVLINGTNCPKNNYINATIEIRNSKYVRISGITVNHSAKGGITLMATPLSFIKIDNCTISNSSSFAFKAVYGTNNLTFEYNYIYNNFNNWSQTLMSQETISLEHVTTFSINHIVYKENHAGSINMKGGCSRGIVCYNDINTTGGFVIKGSPGWGGVGIMMDARGISHNISIYNNNIYGNVSGITLNTETSGHYENIYIYNNLVNITATGGAPTANARNPMMLSNTGSSTDLFHHIYIYSNTFIVGENSTGVGIKVGHYTLNQLNSNNLQNVYIANNIFYSYATASGYAFWEMNKISYEDGVFIINNNSFYRPSGIIRIYWNGSYYSSSTNPEKFGYNPLFTNPKFVDANNGDFHLESNSPCIDTGNYALAPSFDFDNLSRPQGEGYDIGAFEYPSGLDTTPPIPNPSTWSIVPYASSSTTISMTATTATDPSGGILYYFDETTGNPGATDSGWQSSSSYTNSGLSPGMTYTYRVCTRDSLENIGSWSISNSATPQPSDTIPPQITSLSITTSNPLDTDPIFGWVNVSCMVTDNVAVSQVTLRIHNPINTWNNVSMIAGTSGIYYYLTNTAFSAVGNYTYSIRATDSSGNPSYSNNILFSMSPNWDINNDGRCNILDLVMTSNKYSNTGAHGWIREDVDNNGIINVLDMNLISNQFGEVWYN